jgi:hypothetical protein
MGERGYGLVRQRIHAPKGCGPSFAIILLRDFQRFRDFGRWGAGFIRRVALEEVLEADRRAQKKIGTVPIFEGGN